LFSVETVVEIFDPSYFSGKARLRQFGPKIEAARLFFWNLREGESFPKQGGRKNRPKKSSARLIFSSALPEKTFPKPIFSSALPEKCFPRLIFSFSLPEKSFPQQRQCFQWE